jgi:ATP-dependent Clp protease adaptor protein ClpS
LIRVCNHTPEQAEQCSLIVHYNGKCTVKTGPYDKLKPQCTQLLEANENNIILIDTFLKQIHVNNSKTTSLFYI